MLGNGSENVSSGLLVESVLLRERVDELGKDLVRDNSLGEFVRVVSETSKSKGG